MDDGQATAFSAFVVPVGVGPHDDPPEVDEMAVPAAPTARHAPPGRHETPFSVCVPVFEPAFQLVPSFVKRTMAAPTTAAPDACASVRAGVKLIPVPVAPAVPTLVIVAVSAFGLVSIVIV